MSYQAVIRNSNLELVTNTAIGMQISILQGSASGTAVYVEIQTPTTNDNGLASIEIGAGTVQSGDFAAINWEDAPYFIKTETDPSGGTSYTITGTSQLLSVPFALHANEVDPSIPQGTGSGEMQYWNGTQWVTVTAGNEGQVLTFTGGLPAWTKQLEDGEVQNPTTGEIWMDRNLGASQVATSSTDTAAYGDLYQWGRGTDGHEKRNSGTTSSLSTTDNPGHDDFILAPNSPYDWRSPQNDNLWQGVSGINNPCPSGYRLPTRTEWETERESWSSNNAAGAFASVLKLPMAGYRYGSNGSLLNMGSFGYYWSSTINVTYSIQLYFYSFIAYISNGGRVDGVSVRCIKD
ncbi:MAG: FISUMP domain-containing protein [Bacteroidales bacterium]|nr:FISUMP domain-containing protein [Bacteroidales bacterium]